MVTRLISKLRTILVMFSVSILVSACCTTGDHCNANPTTPTTISKDLDKVKLEYSRKPQPDTPPRNNYTFIQINSDGSYHGVSRQPLAIATDKMWSPGQILRVSIVGAEAPADTVSNELRAKIQRYATEWSRWGNVRFEFVSDPVVAHIRIRVQTPITFTTAAFGDRGSWSYIGRDALTIPLDQPTMNLGWLADSGTSDEEIRRVVQHEFGHALGFIHEHQSPAAGIPWDRNKVSKYYSDTLGWDEAKVTENIFNQADQSKTNYSQFDPASIMLYHIDPEMTTNGYTVGWNRALSATDKDYMGRFYPYPPGATGTLFTGDDCDTISFDVQRGIQDQENVRFILRLGSGVTWWKSIRIPTQGGGHVEIEAQDSNTGETTIAFSNLDQSRPIGFSKAKFLGIHTRLNYSWSILPALENKTRVILQWNKDTCR